MLFRRFPFYGVHIRSKTYLTSGVIKGFHFPWFTLSHLCPNMVIRRGEDGGANGDGGADVGGSVGGDGGATFGLRGWGATV